MQNEVLQVAIDHRPHSCHFQIALRWDTCFMQVGTMGFKANVSLDQISMTCLIYMAQFWWLYFMLFPHGATMYLLYLGRVYKYRHHSKYLCPDVVIISLEIHTQASKGCASLGHQANGVNVVWPWTWEFAGFGQSLLSAWNQQTGTRSETRKYGRGTPNIQSGSCSLVPSYRQGLPRFSKIQGNGGGYQNLSVGNEMFLPWGIMSVVWQGWQSEW